MKLYPRNIWLQTQPQDLGKLECPFCYKTKEESEYIIWKGKHWLIIHNKFPILGLDTHIMAIPKKHTLMASDITPEVMSEYPEVMKFIQNFYAGEKYFSFMRESLQSRSLEHLHYHFISGKIGYKDIEELLKKQGF